MQRIPPWFHCLEIQDTRVIILKIYWLDTLKLTTSAYPKIQKKKWVKEKASGEKCNIYRWQGTHIYKNKYVFIHISLPTKKEKRVCMANKH